MINVPPTVLVKSMDEEAVILNLETEMYHMLNPTGLRMWQLLTTIESLDEIIVILQQEYEVDADTLKVDLQEFVERLVAAGIIEAQ